MKKKISKFKIWKGKNIKGFSFFLIAAFLFLVLNKLSDTYTQNIDVKVKIDGLKEEMKLVNDSSDVVRVLVKGRGFNFIPFVFKEPDPIYLDYTKDIRKGDANLSWDAFNNAFKLNESLGNAMEVLSVNPDTLYFKYDMLSYKSVPLKIMANFSFASGYDLQNELISPTDSVKLIGLSEELKHIEYVETERLNFTDISSDFEKSLKIISPENSKVKLMPNMVTLKGEVKRFTEGEVRVPIIMENVPNEININFFPKEVDVLYYVSLDNYNAIKPENFKVICDFDERSDHEQYFLIPKVVAKPESVKRTRLRQGRIEFIILE